MNLCMICQKSYITKNGLNQHIRRNHNCIKYYNDFLKINDTDGICKTCGNNTKFISLESGYLKYCNTSCSAKDESVKEKRRETKLKKYGSETYNNPSKSKSTKKELYGDENAFCYQSETMKNIIKNKYGNENYNNSKKMLNTKFKKYGFYFTNTEKRRDTNIKKYGVDNVAKSEKIKSITEKTNILKYGHKSPTKNLNVKMKLKNSIYKNSYNNLNRFEFVIPLFTENEYHGIYEKYKFKCVICNNIFYSNLVGGKVPKCNICYPSIANNSSGQIEIYNFIKLYDNQIIENDRNVLNGTELDIYLPNKNIAIEYDGLYWHSELSNGKDKNYHINKTNLCENKNIFLLHIFENEWLYKQNIIKSIIKSKLNIYETKIYARNCQLKEINYNESTIFLNENHLQGADKNKVRIALIYEDNIVSIMTFGKSRFNKKYEWEMLRFCNKTNTKVIGAASKLLSHFIKKYNPNSIITYADRRYSNGNLYEKIGFKLNGKTNPGYYYTKGNDLYNRQTFQKHKLKNFLKIYNPKLSEWENMQLNGYDRIWDCGHLRYTFQNAKMENNM